MLFVTAFFLGLIFNAAPGAVFVETVKQGASEGFRPALQTQLGSLIGDATWAFLGLSGIGFVVQIDALRLPLGLAGVCYLIYLAWDSWRAAGAEGLICPDSPHRHGSAFRKGVSLSLTNPQNLAFWAAMGSVMTSLGVHESQTMNHMVFMAGFMASSLIWCFVCAAAVDRILRQAGGAWKRLTYRLCSASLLLLALSALLDLMKPTSDHGTSASTSEYVINTPHSTKAA